MQKQGKNAALQFICRPHFAFNLDIYKILSFGKMLKPYETRGP